MNQAPTTPAQTLSVQLPEGTMSYLKQGRGPALIIVHGIGGRKEDWAGVAGKLAATHTVYAVDMIGFGASDKTQAQINITLQAEAVRSLMQREGINKAAIIGNSLGGWVAATLAVKHPELVERMVLVDAAGLKVTLSGPPPVNFAPDTVEEMQKLLTTVLESEFAHTREFAAQALAQFKASGEAVTLQKLFTGFASSSSPDRPLDDLLPQIKCPVLVVWGAEDHLFPAVLADVVAGRTPGAKKVLIAKASHFPQIDQPDAFVAAVVPFLAR